MTVLQVLYEVDTAKHDPQTVFEQRAADDPLPDGVADFARTLMLGVLEHRLVLDRVIAQIAPEWPLEQIAPVDRNILRIGVYEVLLGRETPVKVAINEAIELAKIFGSDASPRFVNGALGALADRLNEFTQQVGRQQ